MKWYNIFIALILISCSNNDEDMKLFMSSLSQTETTPTSPFPIADDGYLYVYSMGQSNMVGQYPQASDDWRNPGDMTNPTNVWAQDWSGGWKEAEYDRAPFAQDNANNMAITFCRELADKYGLKIRLMHIAISSRAIERWMEDDPDPSMWVMVVDEYNKYKTNGVWNDNIRPASLWLQAQGEANDGNSYTEYFTDKWNQVEAQHIREEYMTDNHHMIFSQVSTNTSNYYAFNDNLQQKCDENPLTFRVSHGDGVTKGDVVHYSGEGLEKMGKRMLERYEEMIFNIPPPNDLIKPTIPYPFTATDIDADGFTLSWGTSTVNPDLTLVGYNVHHRSGFYVYSSEDINTHSIRIEFTVVVGQEEAFTITGIDSAGNQSYWASYTGILKLIR